MGQQKDWIEDVQKAPLTFIIHLLWSELEFDIQYGVIKRAKMRGVEGKSAKNYKFTDADKDWMYRAIDKAVYNVKSKMAWCCKNTEPIMKDELDTIPVEYQMLFQFDGVIWLGSPDNLMSYIHSYITDYCLADWMEMEMEGQQSYAVLAERAEETLGKAFKEVNQCVLDNEPKFIL